MTVAQCAQQMLEIEVEKKEGGMYLISLTYDLTNASGAQQHTPPPRSLSASRVLAL